jgi:methionyl-tRNA synthetase
MNGTATTERRTYFVTTPIYYVNDQPHIGHAYTTLAADVTARFRRLAGADVFFLTGTDEHGQKVAQSAATAGITPQEFTDRVSQNFRDLTQLMNFSNDDFIRTTESRNKAAAQALWRAMANATAPDGQPAIYLGSYSGWYAVRDEAFYDESELRSSDGGVRLAPTGAPVAWVEEPSYFFRLSAYGDALLALYDANPDFIGPSSRRNEITSFVKGGLRDLSISRTSFSWGVPVPGDETHVMYVWLDALVNYIAALGYPEIGLESRYARFWPADLHLVGKDIVRFHTVYWPAFLMAAGLQQPHRVFAHGWWTIEGQKMSKSLGNAIAPRHLVETYGLDQTRYLLMAEVPFGNDGDFSHKAAIRRINADLANGLGNLAQRTLTLIQKNCGGRVPMPGPFSDGESVTCDRAILNGVDALQGACSGYIFVQRFHEVIKLIWETVSLADAYIDANAPWALKKTDPARMSTVLYVLAETLRGVAIVLQPFMPDTMARLLDQLGVPADRRDFFALGEAGRLVPGTPLPPPKGLFPRIVEPDAAVP